VRPGYPEELRQAILAYLGGRPAEVVEVGAGTGKGTAVLAGLGAPVTCLEPDPRMAAVLREQFPQVRVAVTTLEQWTAPAGGVAMIAAAMSWHLLDAATRNRRAHDSLAPGGALAVFGHRYGYADPRVGAAILAALRAVDPSVRERPDGWFREDIVASGLFTDVQTMRVDRHLQLAAPRYLQLVQTFSSFRRHDSADRAAALAGLTSVLDDFGGTVTLELRTSLLLARRPGGQRVEPEPPRPPEDPTAAATARCSP
jgi:SAM-dependent methyltransferase